MTGMDVARMYRLMRGNMARAPIIMFSANVTTEARDESIEAGADEFVPKPIQVNSLLQTLQQLVTDFKVSGPPENRFFYLSQKKAEIIAADGSDSGFA